MTEKKTIIITGANAGIGLAIATQAALQQQRVILACRNLAKAEMARQEVLDVAPDADVLIRALDLSSFDSVREFAQTVESEFPVIDVLVNNAGIYPVNEQYTQEGYEMQFGVNYLGHFLLTHLLLPVLGKSNNARIIHVSSVGHLMGRIDSKTFRGRKYYLWGMPSYGQSKLANILLSNELSRRLPCHITNNAVHPGFVDSDFFRDLPGLIYKIIRRVLVSTEQSGKFIAEMALSGDWSAKTGKFVSAQGPLPVSPKTRDLKLSQQLYIDSCQMTGVAPIDSTPH